MPATQQMSPELTAIVALRNAFLEQYGVAPSIMTLPHTHVNALGESPFFKRTAFSISGTIGTFMGMSIRGGSSMIASDESGSTTLEAGEVPNA